MRKEIILMVAMCMSQIASADTIFWGNDSSITPVQDEFGVNLAPASTYLVTIWNDGALSGAGNGIMDDYLTGDDTMVASVGGTWSSLTDFTSGGFFAVIDPTLYTGLGDGEQIYTRIFNASTIGAATMYVDLDSSLATIQDSSPSSIPPASPWTYDPTGAVAGDWQPIPEPATIALMGVGLLGLASRRRKK